MLNRFIQQFSRYLGLGLLMVALLGSGFAMAQAEPTMKEIYQAAQSGKLDQAQVMVQQVLVIHPNSAKAHYVQAELFARQGQASKGRDALAAAEKIAPGLPFAKPEAVQALRTQLAAKPGSTSSAGSLATPAAKEARPALGGGGGSSSSSSSSSSSFPLGLGLALGGGAIALAIFFMRKKPAPAAATPFGYANPNTASTMGSGLSGPQSFGTAGGGAATYGGQPGYGQPAYGQQPNYGGQQPAGSGLGGRLAGGLATGLAVGAGVMAAQAIGKSFMDDGASKDHAAAGGAGAGHSGDSGASNFSSAAPLSGNNDMGGDNFGIDDTSSWDDGGSVADAGGDFDMGGDWDV